MRKVDLFISCRKLKDKDTFSKSDPYVEFHMKTQIGQNKSEEYQKIGRTETMKNNLNPDFLFNFQIDYIFESKQECLFEVFDEDENGKEKESLGICKTTMAEIVGAKLNTLVCDLEDKHKSGKHKGKIIIRTDSVADCNDMMFMQWKGQKLMNTDGWFGDSDPFLRFNRERGVGTKDFVKIHETEVIKNNLSPIWQPFQMSCQKLCNGDHNKNIQLECWDWEKNGKFQYIGTTNFSVNDLFIKGQREFYLYSDQKKKVTGTLYLEQFQFERKYGFLDYIKGGIQLNLSLAVDFTGSNGDPQVQNSLHYINPNGQLNQYETAIKNVGEILLGYDYDKHIPIYGFGAQLRYPNLQTQQVQHCFPMTGNPQQAETVGLDGIMHIYKYSLQHVIFSGPTYFNPLITETLKLAQINKNQGSKQYIILLILTDGDIHDMDQTINSIVDASELPISIIIVGVGNEDFKSMRKLDGDEGLTGSKGKSKRDVVQFVAFKEMNGNGVKLAQEVLKEIPSQLLQYYSLVGVLPNPPQQFELNQV